MSLVTEGMKIPAKFADAVTETQICKAFGWSLEYVRALSYYDYLTITAILRAENDANDYYRKSNTQPDTRGGRPLGVAFLLWQLQRLHP